MKRGGISIISSKGSIRSCTGLLWNAGYWTWMEPILMCTHGTTFHPHENIISAPNNSDPPPFDPVLPRSLSLSTSSCTAPQPPPPNRRSAHGSDATAGAYCMYGRWTRQLPSLVCVYASRNQGSIQSMNDSDGRGPGAGVCLPPDVFGGGKSRVYIAGWITR